nr:alpha/beta hydrolase [Hyphomicrobium sp.]
MQHSEPQTATKYLEVGAGPDARSIAYRHVPSEAPGATGVFWLSGFMSDMASTKATAVVAWAARQG